MHYYRLPKALHILRTIPLLLHAILIQVLNKSLCLLTRVALLTREPHYLDISGPEMAPDQKKSFVFTESSQGIYTGAGAVFSLRL